MAKEAPIVLIDMDGVVADFELAFLNIWKEKYPKRHFIELEDRRSFYTTSQYPAKWWPQMWKIMTNEGFFANMEPLEGSIKSIKKMARSGYEIYFCSAPLIQNPYCASEKYAWIKKQLGRKWEKRLILSSDKTLVQGNFLIDDRDKIKGDHKPSWEHLIFDRPYNREVKSNRRINWDNWREVLSSKEK